MAKVISLTILLFVIRLILVFFGETIGIMPYLVEDVLFYILLLIFGLAFTFFHLYRIEKKNLKNIGFESDNILKSILYGIIGILPLMAMTPLMVLLTDITLPIPPTITIGKIIIALSFTLLGALYEEIMFRGIIQDHLSETMDNDWKVIILTAAIFTATHVFYLPFTGFGIYYIFVFVMAIILSWLRIHRDQISCAIVHGGIVFILIILV